MRCDGGGVEGREGREEDALLSKKRKGRRCAGRLYHAYTSGRGRRTLCNGRAFAMFFAFVAVPVSQAHSTAVRKAQLESEFHEKRPMADFAHSAPAASERESMLRMTAREDTVHIAVKGMRVPRVVTVGNPVQR